MLVIAENKKINKKRAYKLNSRKKWFGFFPKAQNNYFHVKIGFRILTTTL
jgi:hypothetical protein